MKTNSPLFDRIRVKPDQDRRLRTELPPCEWPRCDAPATHRAPKGRLQANEYWRFCLDHVREYNNSYNFFRRNERRRGRAYQKEALTGHRPTWKMGSSAASGGANGAPGRLSRRRVGGRRSVRRVRRDRRAAAMRGRRGGSQIILNAQRRAFDALGLEADANRTDIKAKFKMLVKRHHPDANGGDRGSEDKLREIIQAYNYLKSAGSADLSGWPPRWLSRPRRFC